MPTPGDTVTATPSGTANDLVELQACEAATRGALGILNAGKPAAAGRNIAFNDVHAKLPTRLPPAQTESSTASLPSWGAFRPGTCRVDQPLGPTIAKIAPCGSRQWAIQLPPGTCVGPWMTWPPLSFTRAIAASTAWTLK